VTRPNRSFVSYRRASPRSQSPRLSRYHASTRGSFRSSPRNAARVRCGDTSVPYFAAGRLTLSSASSSVLNNLSAQLASVWPLRARARNSRFPAEKIQSFRDIDREASNVRPAYLESGIKRLFTENSPLRFPRTTFPRERKQPRQLRSLRGLHRADDTFSSLALPHDTTRQNQDQGLARGRELERRACSLSSDSS